MPYSAGTTQQLKPSRIHFSQDSIAQEFSHGFHSGDTITELFRQVIEGETSVEDIERISVFYQDDRYWAYRGNRRLYVLQQLEKHGFCKSIPVFIVQSPFECHNQHVGITLLILRAFCCILRIDLSRSCWFRISLISMIALIFSIVRWVGKLRKYSRITH